MLEAASVPAAESAGMSGEDHRRALTVFVAALLADFDRYLERSGGDGATPDLLGDGVGYRQAALWLTDEEFGDFVTELRAVGTARMANRPAAGRRRRVLTTVLMPGEG